MAKTDPVNPEKILLILSNFFVFFITRTATVHHLSKESA